MKILVTGFDPFGQEPINSSLETMKGLPDVIAGAQIIKLPIRDMVHQIQSKGIPASVSNSAGTFVYNHVTYGVCHLIATEYPGRKSGFIHVPFLPGQTVFKKNVPSMSLDMIIDGVAAAIEAIVVSN